MSYIIVRLALFLYVKQYFTSIDLWNNVHIGTLFASINVSLAKVMSGMWH